MEVILTDEEIKTIEENINGPAKVISALIATLRHVQTELQAQTNRVEKWQQEAWDYKHENTRLREALEEIAGYDVGEKGTCDINFYHCVMGARQALATEQGTSE